VIDKPHSAAAVDLGLAEKLSEQEYTERLNHLVLVACAQLGVEPAAEALRLTLSMLEALQAIKPRRGKRPGAHNPVDDELLLQLWKAYLLTNPNMEKTEFAKLAAKNHIRPTTAATLKRHLDRLLRAKRDK
jgi:hypothetical protein